jgi:hypothetical protein
MTQECLLKWFSKAQSVFSKVGGRKATFALNQHPTILVRPFSIGEWPGIARRQSSLVLARSCQDVMVAAERGAQEIEQFWSLSS